MKPLIWWALVHGSREPMSVTGNDTVWNGTLSLAMNCVYSTSSASYHQPRQSRPSSSAAHSAVAPRYSIGASNHT